MDDRHHDLSEPLLAAGDEDRAVDCESPASPPTLAPGNNATLAVEEGAVHGSSFASGLEIQAGSSLGERLEPAAVAADDEYRDVECATKAIPPSGGTSSDIVPREEAVARGPSSASPLEVQADLPNRGSDPSAVPESLLGLLGAIRCFLSVTVLTLTVIALPLTGLFIYSAWLGPCHLFPIRFWVAMTFLAASLTGGLWALVQGQGGVHSHDRPGMARLLPAPGVLASQRIQTLLALVVLALWLSLLVESHVTLTRW
jgi:hypothetical protein